MQQFQIRPRDPELKLGAKSESPKRARMIICCSPLRAFALSREIYFTVFVGDQRGMERDWLRDLFEFGIAAKDVKNLQRQMEDLKKRLPPLQNF
jgi:hypothetical protein